MDQAQAHRGILNQEPSKGSAGHMVLPRSLAGHFLHIFFGAHRLNWPLFGSLKKLHSQICPTCKHLGGQGPRLFAKVQLMADLLVSVSFFWEPRFDLFDLTGA